MSGKLDKEWLAWLELSKPIGQQTDPKKDESEKSKRGRITKLGKVANVESFCEFYFLHYKDSKFGWFHKTTSRKILGSNRVFEVLERARDQFFAFSSGLDDGLDVVEDGIWLLYRQHSTGRRKTSRSGSYKKNNQPAA